MSPKNKKFRQQHNGPKQQAVALGQAKPSSPAKSVSLTDKIDGIITSILDGAHEEDSSKVVAVQPPENVTANDLDKLYANLERAKQFLDQQQGRLDKSQSDFEKSQATQQQKQQKIEERERALADGRKEIDEQRTTLAEKEREFADKQATLNLQEADLTRREMDARAGFQNAYRSVFENAQAQLTEYENSLARMNQEVIQKRLEDSRQWQSELDRLRKSAEIQMIQEHQAREEQRVKLEEVRRSLETERLELRRRRIALEADIEIYNQDKQSLEETIEHRIAARMEMLNNQLQSLRELYHQSGKERERLNKALLDWENIRMRIGKEPEIILETIENLTRERDSLAIRLRNAPSENDLQRLSELERQQADWETKLWTLGQQNAELNVRLNQARTQGLEVETLRDQIIALEANRKVLQYQLTELKTDVERRIGDAQGESPFPQLHSFDRSLQDSLDTQPVRDLQSLANEAQMRIANQGLFYELRDIRSFIGGLAMSRTMILQGISGTGKTSLPFAFAQVIDGGCEVVEVQAGWRDRDDLLGHYNAFEKKFFEKKFLQALYQAQCPKYEDRVFIILLDEMNLSYPEQYFADLLSILQMPRPEDRKIDLIPAIMPGLPYPARFVNDQRSIRVPQNVWFIGTANQDETTKDIADKTYDRSHIMELPAQHPDFKVERITSAPERISSGSLQESFRSAQRDQAGQKEAVRTWKFLEALRPNFGDRYGLGWGNRLQKQIEQYVPVVVGCGGDWAEATDDILAMKILRKLRNRYEIQHNDLEQLLDLLNDVWRKNGEKTSLEQGLSHSLRIIQDEQSRKHSRSAEEQE